MRCAALLAILLCDPGLAAANGEPSGAAAAAAAAMPAISAAGGVLDLDWVTLPAISRQPPVHTRARFQIRGAELEVIVEADDPDPAGISATLDAPDRLASGTDAVRLFIDPAGAARFAQVFVLDAAGSISDGLHHGVGINTGPDFVWSGDVRRSAQGWQAVFRTPLSSLRIGERERPQLRVFVERSRPRGGADVRLASAPVGIGLGDGCVLCQMHPLIDLPSGSAFVTWTLAPGLSTTQERATGQPTLTQTRASLDFEWRPNSRWMVDGTINPDFADRDVDEPVLSSNARFAVSSPERRRFFLERSDLLDMAGRNWVFSRSWADPRWGVRGLFGNQDADAVMLALRDRGGDALILPGPFGSNSVTRPASDVVLARFKAGAGPVQGGAVLSQRRYDAGENTLVGAEGQLRWGEGWRVRGAAAGSRTTAFAGPGGVLSPGAARQGSDVFGLLERRQGDGSTGFSAALSRRSEDFRVDNGFVTQTGVERASGNWFGTLARDVGSLSRLALETDPYVVRVIDGPVQRLGLPVALYAFTRWGSCKLGVAPGARVRADATTPLWRDDTASLGCDAYPGHWLTAVSGRVYGGHEPDYVHSLPGRVAGLSFSAEFAPAAAWKMSGALDMQRVRGQSPDVPLQPGVRQAAAQMVVNYQFAPLTRLRLVYNWTRLAIDDGVPGSVWSQRGRAGSLLLAHVPRRGFVGMVGLTQTNQQESPPASALSASELFAKLAWIL